MTEYEASSHVEELTTYLNESVNQTEQIGKAINRTIQVLNKRGIQILIDFNDMVHGLQDSLDNIGRNGQAVRRELSQFQELAHTSALITSSLELDQVLEEVMDTIVKLTGAERAYLMLRQANSEELHVQAARNWEQETISEQDVTFSQGIIQAAIDAQKPLVTTNAQDDERFQEMRSVFSHDLRSLIVIPLLLKEEVVGVLYADNRIEQGIFRPSDIPILSAFASQAAIAISNARIFEQVRDDLKEARRQVENLQIIIDQQRVEQQVAEVTESEYFKDLVGKAREMRKQASEKKNPD
ncbi:MAG: GAF domain-containing protein [Anaerolineae bacterium]|nr:GAF domain-containing protein [Anaerolineae bacterium]